MAGDGIVVKGQAYGIRSIRIDGNDALAVYSAISAAREMAINEQRPILIEVLIDFSVTLISCNGIIPFLHYSLCSCLSRLVAKYRQTKTNIGLH